MLTKSKAYRDLEQAGYLPLFYVYLSTDITRRLFMMKGTPPATIGTGLWDGSRYVGDGSTYGAQAGVSQVETLLLSISPIAKTTAQSTRGLFMSLSASAVGHVSATFDNMGRFFSAITSGESPETFIDGPIEIRQGFETLPFGDQLIIFSGTIFDATINGPEFRISADAITSTLYDIFEIPKSGAYSAPAEENSALPMLFGNIAENSSQGVVVCPQLTSTVWALACHAIQTEAGGNTITLYDDDGVISTSDYAVTDSGDFESLGDIAYATFSVAPTGTVTATLTGGAVDESDNVLTNPADIAEKMLSLMGDATSFESTSFATFKDACDTAAYTGAGIIIADNAKSYWLSDIVASFLGSWFLNEDNEIVLQIESATTNFLATAADLRQRDATKEPVLKPTRDNIITRPIINYAFSAAKVDRRYKTDALTSYLQTYSRAEVSGDISQEISFNWTRNTATVTALAALIEDIYGAAIKVYTWKTQDFTALNTEPGDYISYDNNWQYDENGNELSGQVGRVINITIEPAKQVLSLDFYDTGNFLLAAPYLWNGERYVGDGIAYGGERAA